MGQSTFHDALKDFEENFEHEDNHLSDTTLKEVEE